jgi:hypothetical protein
MLVEIEIRFFRGIGSGSVPLAPFTVLLGLNGGGKTAVLEALYLAASAGIRKDPVGRVPLRHVLRRHGGGDAGGVEVGLEVLDHPERPALRMTLARAGGLIFHSAPAAEILLVAPRGAQGQGWTQALRAVLLDPAAGGEAEEGLWRGADAPAWKGGWAPWVAERLAAIYGLPPFRIVGEASGAWAAFEEGGLVPVSGMGDGIRAAFRALSAMAALGEGLFLWDSPELHQHPEAIPRLMKTLADALDERDHFQIVIATQSLEVLQALRDIFAKKSPEVLAIVVLRRDERTGELEAHRLSADDLDLMLRTERDPRLLLEGRRIPARRGISPEALEELLRILEGGREGGRK